MLAIYESCLWLIKRSYNPLNHFVRYLLWASYLNYDEANNLVVEISNNCEKLAMDRFLIQARRVEGDKKPEYVVYLEPFLGMVLKQEVKNILDKYHLCLREEGNGAIIYSQQAKTCTT